MRMRGRVLVVDDDRGWLELFGETLEREGFSVDLATTTSQALEFLSGASYHMLVLDISLEEGNSKNTEGMLLLERIAELGLSQYMNITMLSAHGTSDQM